MGALARLVAGAALCLALAAPVVAQDVPASALLIIDVERLYSESAWGKRAQAEVDADSQALQAENRTIEATLTTEEKDLTEKRATMAPEEFRPLADAFDARVTVIRREQDAKARELTGRVEEDRKAFLDAAVPVIGEVMRARGAEAILDSRAVFLSAKSIDVTDEVRARIDTEVGDGPAAP